MGSLRNPSIYDGKVLAFDDQSCMFFSDPPRADDEMMMTFWLVGPEVLENVRSDEVEPGCAHHTVPGIAPSSSALAVRCDEDEFSLRVYIHGGDATLTCSLHTPFELQPEAEDLPSLCVEVMKHLATSSDVSL